MMQTVWLFDLDNTLPPCSGWSAIMA